MNPRSYLLIHIVTPLCAIKKHGLQLLFLFLTPLLALLPSEAFALPKDKYQTIHVAADHVSIDDKNQISVYKGNVEFQQGSIKITADIVELHAVNGRLNRIIANGQPATFKQQIKQNMQTVRGHARIVEYTLNDQLLSFTDEAHFQQGDNTFSGEKMIYDTKNEILQAHGNKQSGKRVRIVIQPNTLGDVSN